MQPGVLVPYQVAVMAGASADDLAGARVTATAGARTTTLADLAAVASGPGGAAAAERVYQYYQRCQQLAARPPEGGGVPACETLVDVTQVARGDRRRDLGEEAAALAVLPGFGSYFDELTAAAPSLPTLQRSAVGLRIVTLAGTVPRTGQKGRAVLEWRTSAAIPWPARLGGAARVAEVERSLLLEVRWAPWRDRRIRRLSRVAIRSHQLWPSAAGLE